MVLSKTTDVFISENILENPKALSWSVKDIKHLAREPGLAHLRVRRGPRDKC